MFDAAVWGTVGQWVSGIGTTCAMLVTASVFGVDLYRKRREQALSVVAWVNESPTLNPVLHPKPPPTIEQGRFKYDITIANLSNKPIFSPGAFIQNEDVEVLDNRYEALYDRGLALVPPRGFKSGRTIFFKVNKEGVLQRTDISAGEEFTQRVGFEYELRDYLVYVFFQRFTWQSVG